MDKYINQIGNNILCSKCDELFIYYQEETQWDKQGYGYDTKLVKCPYCGQMNIIKYKKDYGLDVNNDTRYY